MAFFFYFFKEQKEKYLPKVSHENLFIYYKMLLPLCMKEVRRIESAMHVYACAYCTNKFTQWSYNYNYLTTHL